MRDRTPPAPVRVEPAVAAPGQIAVVDAPVSPQPGPGEPSTREAVVRLLLAESPLTAPQIATRLGLTTTGVRRHLDELAGQGAVTARESYPHGARGRGRPPRAYVLTETGRARLPHGYDELAGAALDFLAEQAGPEAVTAFARRRAEMIVAGVQDELAAAPDLPARAELIAQAFTAHGFAANAREVGVGVQLCQHHCPVAHVAARYPQLCEQEFAVLSQALGSYAQRLATIARGDSFCTTFIPVTAVGVAGTPDPHQTAHPSPQKRTTS